ncbi:MAG: hypothetical protein WCA11_07805 [Terracidiphilus sp.]
MVDSDQQTPEAETSELGVQERFVAHPDEGKDGLGGGMMPPQKPKSGLMVLLVGLLVIGVAAYAVLGTKKSAPKSDSEDLGAGIDNASGLRGHLVAGWKGNVEYQLRIEPIDPRENAGFAVVTANPQAPISIHVRLLDSSGFVLCSTDIVLPFDPSKAHPNPASEAKGAEAQAQFKQALEQAGAGGKDVLYTETGADGKIDALNAKGVLPCSEDEYRRFDYWDFSSNFPTLAEQDVLLGHKPAKIEEANEFAVPKARPRRKAVKKGQTAFYIEGDDRIVAWDSSRDVLDGDAGHRFSIPRKSDQVIAAAWAEDNSMIHYKCDPHAVCALIHAGSASVVMARLNE